jgi:SAM-dependent methyltransferase
MHKANIESDLCRIYRQRFTNQLEQRRAVWRVLVEQYFQQFIPESSTVLDLGCGYGEFINQIRSKKKFGMDLNPDAASYLSHDVQLLEQDCSTKWDVADESLDIVFTSNFFEHLPSKAALGHTLDEAKRFLRPETGRLIALGPNIKFLNGTYWDFWDHHLLLTDCSLAEALATRGFHIEKCLPRFLP